VKWLITNIGEEGLVWGRGETQERVEKPDLPEEKGRGDYGRVIVERIRAPLNKKKGKK